MYKKSPKVNIGKCIRQIEGYKAFIPEKFPPKNLSFQGEMSELLANMGKTVLMAEDFVGEVGLESVSDFYGHVCNLHVTLPMAESKEDDAGFPMRLVSWPMNADVLEHQLRTGGASVYAHPFDKLSDAEEAMLDQIGDGNHLMVEILQAQRIQVVLSG